MKLPNTSTLGLPILVGLSLITPAFAAVSIDYVTVGNPGNAVDTTTGYGAVSYSYNIGTYDVTNSQYAAMLNSVASRDTYSLYNSGMATYGITRSGSSGHYTYNVTGDMANNPVVYVSWYDAARFCNWMQNGQGSGSTETGAYTLNGAMSGIIIANSGAMVRLPTEDEWYKAAYYNGSTSDYSLYAIQSNSITTAQANFNNAVGTTTPVGSYGIASSYGTYDQSGNVWNWNDAVNGSLRGLRGGSWSVSSADFLASSNRYGLSPSGHGGLIGFRVASVPEPSATILAIIAFGHCLIRRKR